jgi:signal transduction histidine kinase
MHISELNIFWSIAFSFLAFFTVLITVVIFVYFSNKKILKQKMKNKDLELQMQKKILNAVITTQEQERSRIARDLHDDIGSKLNAVLMNIHFLKQQNLENSDRDEISDNTLKACRAIIENSRKIAHNLIPPELENIGVHPAIEAISRDFSRSGVVNVCYANPVGQHFFDMFTSEQQIHLFRIIQELINNSIRHGQAKEISIKFEETNTLKQMHYKDNGVGVPPRKIKESKGIGLKNIFFRAEMINASASFDPSVKNGMNFSLKF